MAPKAEEPPKASAAPKGAQYFFFHLVNHIFIATGVWPESAYSRFMKEEVIKVKAANPGIDHLVMCLFLAFVL